MFGLLSFLVIGLSHALAPRAWVDYFVMLREKGHAGVFVVGFMSLWFGAVIVAFHNVWSGIPVALTLVGWAQVIKGLIYFVFPAFGLRMLGRVSHERAREFVWPGILFIGLAGLLGYHLVTTAG